MQRPEGGEVVAEFPFLPIEVQAFLADTQHLDARESGAYAMLLFHAWLSADCGLPDDDKRLALLARCTTGEWRKIRSTVMGFWFLSRDGRWHQKHLDSKRVEVATKSAKASAAANAKWLKWYETRRADADAYAKRTLSERTAQASPIKSKPESESSSSEISTDAASVAALRRDGSAPLAKPPSMSDRMKALAIANRQKMAGQA